MCNVILFIFFMISIIKLLGFFFLLIRIILFLLIVIMLSFLLLIWFLILIGIIMILDFFRGLVVFLILYLFFLDFLFVMIISMWVVFLWILLFWKVFLVVLRVLEREEFLVWGRVRVLMDVFNWLRLEYFLLNCMMILVEFENKIMLYCKFFVLCLFIICWIVFFIKLNVLLVDILDVFRVKVILMGGNLVVKYK